jgi:hypothetical protein
MSDGDCPTVTAHCCQSQDVGICSALPCPANGGMSGGGDNGPGSTN